MRSEANSSNEASLAVASAPRSATEPDWVERWLEGCERLLPDSYPACRCQRAVALATVGAALKKEHP